MRHELWELLQVVDARLVAARFATKSRRRESRDKDAAAHALSWIEAPVAIRLARILAAQLVSQQALRPMLLLHENDGLPALLEFEHGVSPFDLESDLAPIAHARIGLFVLDTLDGAQHLPSLVDERALRVGLRLRGDGTRADEESQAGSEDAVIRHRGILKGACATCSKDPGSTCASKAGSRAGMSAWCAVCDTGFTLLAPMTQDDPPKKMQPPQTARKRPPRRDPMYASQSQGCVWLFVPFVALYGTVFYIEYFVGSISTAFEQLGTGFTALHAALLTWIFAVGVGILGPLRGRVPLGSTFFLVVWPATTAWLAHSNRHKTWKLDEGQILDPAFVALIGPFLIAAPLLFGAALLLGHFAWFAWIRAALFGAGAAITGLLWLFLVPFLPLVTALAAIGLGLPALAPSFALFWLICFAWRQRDSHLLSEEQPQNADEPGTGPARVFARTPAVAGAVLALLIMYLWRGSILLTAFRDIMQ
jgi:hypothetical protein